MVGQGDLKQCPQVVFCTFDKRGRLSGFSVHAINSNMQTMKKAEHRPISCLEVLPPCGGEELSHKHSS